MNASLRTAYESQLAEARENLAYWKEVERKASVQSWKTRDGESSREVVNHSLREIADNIRRYRSEVERLETLLGGSTGGAFRIGVLW